MAWVLLLASFTVQMSYVPSVLILILLPRPVRSKYLPSPFCAFVFMLFKSVVTPVKLTSATGNSLPPTKTSERTGTVPAGHGYAGAFPSAGFVVVCTPNSMLLMPP
ncbi:MAG: hypothetical protein ACD_67C00238G0001 [uncultured bacterium]|nr:MAG: hypothetical protein ACD_67C00238G0001 [uncultured bacterium]